MKVLLLGKYAPHALKGLIGGSDREAAIKKLMDAVGGTSDYIAFVRGKYYLEEIDMPKVVSAAQAAASAYTAAG